MSPMMNEEAGPIRPLDEGVSAGGPPKPAGSKTPEDIGYTSEAERCANCEHGGDGSTCALHNIPIEPGGHCNTFEVMGGEGSHDKEAEGNSIDPLDEELSEG